MANVSYIDLRRGNVVEQDGGICVVVSTEHITPGKGRGMMQIKLKSLKTGSIVQKRFRPSDKVNLVYVEKKEMEYLYKDATGLIFMDSETYEQITLSEELLGEADKYLTPNTTCSTELYDGKIIDISLPDVVDLKVTETDPVVRGQTATNQYKPATLETGARISVPPFINIDEVVRVDTRTGEYLERAK